MTVPTCQSLINKLLKESATFDSLTIDRMEVLNT